MHRRTVLILLSVVALVAIASLAAQWWLAERAEPAPPIAELAADPDHAAERVPAELAPSLASNTSRPPERAAAEPLPIHEEPAQRAAASSNRHELHGRTLDAADGRPTGAVRLHFFAADRLVGEALSDLRAGYEGHFETELVLAAGESCRVHVGGAWRLVVASGALAVQAAERELSAEELSGAVPIELYVALFEPEPGTTFDVQGELLSERGAWTEQSLPRAGAVWLDLARKSNPSDSRRALLRQEPDTEGRLHLYFDLRDVPNGQWELTLSALDGYRWHPPKVDVEGPIERLSFLRYDEDATVPLAFEVTDALTGAPISGYQVRHLQTTVSSDAGVFLHTGPFDLESFPVQGSCAWSLAAAGYAPAFGDETSFELRGEKRVARVQLQQGWSTKLQALVRAPLAKPLAGAEVYLDERYVGRTRADGTLVLRAPERPTKIDVRAGGLRLVTNPLEAYGGRSAEQRGHVSLAFLEAQR